jgi:glutamate-1-semialdehyde 2,1-aminomutase
MNRIHTAREWTKRAQDVLPGGGFGNFDPGLVIESGQGARVRDVQGREYVDLLIGSGPMVLGHSHPEVMEAVFAALPQGQTFFANNPRGIELAEVICAAVPCADRLRYVSTGGEADMYAMRLARAFTGREKIVKFEGGYHGMSAEAQMSLAPERLANFPNAVPDSAGIPRAVQDGMLIAPFNDPDFIRSLLAAHGQDVAAIIVEPLQRIIPPAPGFLQALRDEADRHGIVLIFDEVVTGFRLSWGGAQAHYGVTPDLCTLGKIIGGGFPLAAIAGRADIMAHFDKTIVGSDGWLMMTGTLSGNPVAAAAGLKTLEVLARDGQIDHLRSLGNDLMKSMTDALSARGIAHRIVGDATLFDVVFTDREVRNYRDTAQADRTRSAAYAKALLSRGVLKPAGKTYPCLALTDDDIAFVDAAFHSAADAITDARLPVPPIPKP